MPAAADGDQFGSTDKAVDSAAPAAQSTAAAAGPQVPLKRPTVVVVIGMAGSGKTTLATALHRHLKQQKKSMYAINLDPAVLTVPFPCNVDIRDTVKYKQVMKDYQLGPNGAILTSLNLFATKFDQVLALLETREDKVDYVLIDTPGQIEAFNWSASGSLILDSLAVSYATVVLYAVDTARCRSPVTFMSNMMYACSVMYKAKLPFILAFNKVDVQQPSACRRWMANYGDFADDCRTGGVDFNPETSYMATLSCSCALAMGEFYEAIKNVAVSAATGEGLAELVEILGVAREEYRTEYLSWLAQQREAVKQRRLKIAQEAAARFATDRAGAATMSPQNADHKKEQQELKDLIARFGPAAASDATAV